MSFYGGRPGKSFSINKVFNNYEELYNDIIVSNMENADINMMAVPLGAFVLINYGSDADEFKTNKIIEDKFFENNPNLKPNVILGDYNASLWWNMSEPGNYNSSVWIKRYSEEKKYYYSYVANIGGIFPKISDTTGNWVIPVGDGVGESDTGISAIGRQIEFNIEYDRQVGYTLLSQNSTTFNLESSATIYGLADLNKKYKYNELADSYDEDAEGTFVYIYAADDKGRFQYEDGYRIELGYFNVEDWTKIETQEISIFTTDWLKWRYINQYDENGNKIWNDLFEVTGLTSIEEFKNEALKSAQMAEDYYYQSEEISSNIENTKEEIDKTATLLTEKVNEALGYSNKAIEASDSVKETIDRFEDIIADQPTADVAGSIALAEVNKSAAEFASLNDRLDQMPYQFDTISLMQECATLSREDKVFTFGMDNIGDGDSSKLFQVFDPNNEIDMERLNEVVEGTITEENPDGEKVIKEQYPLANGLIAGLLTIFSGYGSGGGGGSAVPSLTVTGDEFTLQEGEVIDIDYYWTGPNAGIATLFVTDSNKTSPKVVDYYDSSKVYSSGVKLNGFGSGTISLKPTKGEHNYTIYIIDRAQAYSNEVKVKVTVGGVSLNVNYPDGKSFTANQAITYGYTVNTIYAKPSVLKYTIYKGSQIFDEGSIISSSSAAGSQYIPLIIKTSTQNIGQGEFRIVAYAHVEGDENISTPYITRNFVIMESGIIYLTTSFDGEATPLQQDAVSYIPFELIYSGGSNFVVEGRYSNIEGFNWDKASIIPPGDLSKPNAAGSFTYAVIMPEVGTYYFRFRVHSEIDDTISGESRELKVIVTEKISKYPLVSEDAIQVHYSANRGQTNEANKYIWKNIASGDSSYDARLQNFNYLSNGWEVKDNLPTGYLHCNSKTFVSIDYPFFSNITKTQGGTFEFVFKAADIGRDQTILSMTYDTTGSGFFIYKDKVVLNVSPWNIKDLTAYYNIDGVEDNSKPIHVTLTVDPIDRYVKIYINGVLCRADANMETSNQITRNTKTYINRALSELNPQYGVTKVDCLRYYNKALTSYEVLCNYVHNLRDKQEQAKVYNKNFLDNKSEDAISDEIPYMTFYLTKNEWQTMDKDNIKPKIKVTFHDPNPAEGNESDYEWDKVITSWQGTSSIAYPVKNFKIKLPEKYTLKGNKSLKEKTFCLKADYMDSSHCHNTGNVNFIHQSGLLSKYSLTPAQSKELGIDVVDGYKGLDNLDLGISPGDLKTRTTIDGYPIALYICLETDESASKENNPNKEYESPMFWGIYNFNLDKGSTDSFGLRRDEDDFQNVTSFEIAANSAYDGGGFRAMRFVKKINAEEYGWTKWNVHYTSDGVIDLENGDNLQINIADSTGKIESTVRTIDFKENEIQYQGIYNANRDIKGIYAPELRYNENGILDSQGTYIELFKLDDRNNTFVYEEFDNKQVKVVEGYFEYVANEWSTDVPKDNIALSLKSEWELIDNPINQDFKYKYYENDFELRFPDADIFLTKENKMNKLYYKEYDKLISLVEWVDSVDPNFNFKEEFSEHFDTNTVLNYYLMLMVVGLIDNFGKNLMIDTWGYDKNGNIPYLTTEDGYHKVWKFISEWDEDEEYYKDDGEYQYGLMDVNNPIDSEDGTILYNVYASDENYTYKGDLLGTYEFGGLDGDRIIGWYHETDVSKYIWYPHFYDLDSCLGVNNSGLLSFSPSIEMEDKFYINYEGTEVNNAPFNTSSSALWQQFVKNYSNELKSRYLELVANQIFNIDTFSKYYYTDIVDAMGPRMYNNDAYPKYLSREEIKVVVSGQVTTRLPYSFDHLALGNDWGRIKSWLSKRLMYLYTMFRQKDTNDYGTGFELRSETERTYNFRLECYDPMYMKVIYKKNYVIPKRVTGSNKIVEFSITAGGATDREIYFVPGYNVKYIKEISSPQQGFSSAKLDNGTRLLELDLANSEGLTHIEYEKPSGNLIRKLNFENCPIFSQSITAENYPYLEYINTLGTQATFNFASNGGILEEAYLEASNSLEVNNYADLKNLTIQLTYSEPPSYTDIPLKHNAKYSSASFVNCSNPEFTLNIKGRYKDIATNKYIDVDLRKFIKEYGKLSLFPELTSVTLRNSTIDGGEYSSQLQPNGTVENVKELKLSLPLLEKLEVINGLINDNDIANLKYDKIAFIYSVRKIDGSDKYVGFPGWGQVPDVTTNNGNYTYYGDKTYIAGKVEGIIGDKYIKELEFRAPYLDTSYPEAILPQPGERFEFPWRTYLGNLPGLKRLKFNAKNIIAKNITDTDDPQYLTRKIGINKTSWYPARFELVLPTPVENGLELIYFSPESSNIDFTCIRQKDTNKGEYIIETNSSNINYPINWPNDAESYFEEIETGGVQPLGKVIFHVFKGIDLRGYSNLAMNFKGLTKIKGILGMNALSVSAINDYFSKDETGAFKNYFSNCQSLESFFTSDFVSAETATSPTIYTYQKWNFNPWFNNNAQYFKDISYFFNDCYALKDSTYLTGILKQTSNSFAIEKADYLFNNCKSLKNINLQWIDKNSLQSIEGLCQGCSSLTDANVIITGIDAENKKVSSLKYLFTNCSSLVNPQVVLLDSTGTNYFKNIKTVDYMFQNCINLNTLDLSAIQNGIYLYDFDNLVSAVYWFSGCSNLQSVKFKDKVNFKSLQSFKYAFENCVNLISIFDNSIENKPQFYDPDISVEKLDLTGMFYGCSKLPSVGNLNQTELNRVSTISNLFNGCALLGSNNKGILDLSSLTFADYLEAENAFSGCESLVEIKLPIIKMSKLNGLFNGCKKLANLDVSVITPIKLNINGAEEEINDFSYVFNNCQSLDSNTFNGFENWSVSKASNLGYMFAGCSNLTNLDLSNWNFLNANTISLSHMFEGCSKLTSLTGLNNWFGEYYDVRLEKYPNLKLSGTGVDNLFAGCAQLDFTSMNLSAWARAAIDLESMSNMFNGCKKLTNLNYVFSGIEGIESNTQELKWGGTQTMFNSCAFTKLTNLSYMCAGTGIVNFDYFSTSNSVGYADTTYSRPTTINQMINGCSELQIFNFTPINVGMHNVTSIGSTFFAGCPKLTSISFLGASTTGGNRGIKVMLDLSQVMTSTDTFTYFKTLVDSSAISDWLYTFIPGEATGTYGQLKVSNRQAEYLLEQQIEVNKIWSKGWTPGTETDNNIMD